VYVPEGTSTGTSENSNSIDNAIMVFQQPVTIPPIEKPAVIDSHSNVELDLKLLDQKQCTDDDDDDCCVEFDSKTSR